MRLSQRIIKLANITVMKGILPKAQENITIAKNDPRKQHHIHLHVACTFYNIRIHIISATKTQVGTI